MCSPNTLHALSHSETPHFSDPHVAQDAQDAPFSNPKRKVQQCSFCHTVQACGKECQTGKYNMLDRNNYAPAALFSFYERL
jgi:hypothetical protein